MLMLPAQVYDASDNPDGGIYLRVPYDVDFLDEFKDAIEPGERYWDGYDREWWVSERYSKRAIRIASGYFNIEYMD